MKTISKAIRDQRRKPSAAYKGRKYRTEQVPDHLWPSFLIAKLHEESQEIAGSPRDVTEYADVLEVLLTLAAWFGFSALDIETARIKKVHECGSFSQRYVMVRP